MVDLGSPEGGALPGPAACAVALETQDSSFQLSSFAFDTVAPEGVAGLTTPAAHHRPPPLLARMDSGYNVSVIGNGSGRKCLLARDSFFVESYFEVWEF